MKKLSLIMIMSLCLVLVANSAWSIENNNSLKIEAGISDWQPSIIYSPSLPSTIDFSTAFLIGPTIHLLYKGFFTRATVLFPLSSFEAELNGVQVTWNTYITTCDLIAGYMITPNIGVYAQYFSNSVKNTISSSSTSKLTSLFYIAGPGVGVTGILPFSKYFGIYAYASYILGSYTNADAVSSYGNNIIDLDLGIALDLSGKSVFSWTIGWRYQINSISGLTGIDSIAFSGLNGDLRYKF